MKPMDISANNAGKIQDTGVKEENGPQGIGMAVAIDWGLAAQFVVSPFLPTILGTLGILKKTPSIQVTSVITFWLLAVVFAVFGESIRSGWRWGRFIQLAFNTLLFLAGIVSLVLSIQSILKGQFWTLIPTFILVVISPIIVWRLSRPTTAQWFKTVTAPEARRRHGGSWPWLILIWSIIGGILVVLSFSLGSQPVM